MDSPESQGPPLLQQAVKVSLISRLLRLPWPAILVVLAITVPVAILLAVVVALYVLVLPPLWPILALAFVYLITRARLRKRGISWTVVDQVRASAYSIRDKAKFSAVVGGVIAVVAMLAMTVTPAAPPITGVGDVLLAAFFAISVGLTAVILVRGIAEARGDGVFDEAPDTVAGDHVIDDSSRHIGEG